MICVETLLASRFPNLAQTNPILNKTVLASLRLFCREKAFLEFSHQYNHLEGFDFVDEALNYFDFTARLRDNERERIPTQGPVVIVANHPIGSLDGLALLKLIGSARRDVKIVANELLSAIEPLRSLLLPVDNIGGRTIKSQVQAIQQYLANGGAVIVFPAGEVSRLGAKGIRDGRWNTGFIRFARPTQAPIIPLLLEGRNSLFFYGLSWLAKPASTLWLVREMFKQSHKHLDIRIGRPLQLAHYDSIEPALELQALATLIKKHVYSLSGKKQYKLRRIEVSEAIAHPENRQHLKREIQDCDLLGHTADGKSIYLYRYFTNSAIMREIGRLREFSFRAVQEGTGKRRDTDRFDIYYDHLVLWDDRDLEIVGAYRMMRTRGLVERFSESQLLYSQTLFDFEQKFSSCLDSGMELGRSFVQPRYRGKRSMEYLWQGIGAYLNRFPEIRSLFGPVSISQAYGDYGTALLVHYYSHYFFTKDCLATARMPYLSNIEWGETKFSGDDAIADFKLLKRSLMEKGLCVPTLYKQYTELCYPGGVQFLAFNRDENFGDCIDGLILVDLTKLKPEKHRRYMQPAITADYQRVS